MHASEKAYKEKLRNFFSADEIEIHSVDELQEKLKRRQLLFPNAKVNDFIKANLIVNDILQDKKTKTSLSKEEQKEIFKKVNKDTEEDCGITPLSKTYKSQLTKNTSLESKKSFETPEIQKIKTSKYQGKNYYVIRSILIRLKGRQRGKEVFDFENSKVFNEIRNKKTELAEHESELINEYKKYKKRISDRKTSKLRYLKRLELPKEKLEEIKIKEKEHKRIYARKHKNKINFKNRFRFYILPEEEKEKLRAYRREKAKEWRERNPGKSNERYATWCKENQIYRREAERKRYREMPEEKKQKLLAAKKKWREENKEKIKEYRKNFSKEKREKLAERARRFRELNPESVRATKKKYYEKNKETLTDKKIAERQKIRDAQKKWRMENKDKVREYNIKFLEKIKNKK